MADFTSLGITKDDGQSVCGKLEAYVSISGLTSEYETVGVVGNEMTFTGAPEFAEYYDGFSPWALCKTQETFNMEGSFMQFDAKLLAIALGRPSIDTSSTSYEDVLINSTRINPPSYRWKFVGADHDGKAIEIEMLKGQIRSEVAISLNNTDFAELPFNIQATVDETSTELYDVARIRKAV